MTPIEKIKAIQTILEVSADGQFGPRSKAALESLIQESKSTVSPIAHSVRFDAFMPFILTWEGEVFENDPDDPGGATKFGIDQRSHPGIDIRNLTKAGATEIYWHEWLEAGCADMPSPMAEVFFNCAVNMGLGRAKEFYATAKTAESFLTLQEAKYRSIASHGSMGKFLKGWLNRTNALRKEVGL